MFLKFLLLGIIGLILVLAICNKLTKLKLKHRLQKDLRENKKRQEASKRKMKELEIK